MDDKNLSEKLQELAKGKNRSDTARLREIFDQIETALNAGVLRSDVYQALKEDGFIFSFTSFELAVYRIRKERGKGIVTKASSTKRPVPVPAAATAGENPLRVLSGKAREGEHSPIPLAKFEVDNT